MLAPPWLCKRLFELAKDIRLAWHGVDGTEENPGAFALVQLYPSRVVGPLDNPLIFDTLWDFDHKVNKLGEIQVEPANRGPIFNKDGGTRPDWDIVGLVPVYVANFKAFGYNNEDVLNGSWLGSVESWKQNWKGRYNENVDKAMAEDEKRRKAVAEEASDIFFTANKWATDRAPVLPWKDIKKDLARQQSENREIRDQLAARKIR